MRYAALIFMLLLATAVVAQKPAPVPEPPPLPEGVDAEGLEPEVTILQRGDDQVEEYRIRGRLYMVKVTPAHGVPYFLVDEQGDGVMVRQQGRDRVSVPMWVIGSW